MNNVWLVPLVLFLLIACSQQVNAANAEQVIASRGSAHSFPRKFDASDSRNPAFSSGALDQSSVSLQRSTNAVHVTKTALATITLTSSSTNETLESDLCSSASAARAETNLVILVDEASAPPSSYIYLPGCFFTLYTRLTSLELEGVLIVANSSVPDPLERIGKTCRNLTSLSIRHSQLSHANGTLAPITFSRAFSSLSKLTSLSISDMNMAQSTLSGRLPHQLTSVALGNLGIRGSIPSSFFDAQNATSVDEYSINLSYNALSGSIPSGLFSDWSTRARSYTFNFAHNLLNGSIPGTFLGPIQFTSSDNKALEMILNNNELSGTLSSNFLASDHIDEHTTVNIDLSMNNISGRLPNPLFPDGEASIVSFNASFNRLSGNVPSGLLEFMNVASSDTPGSANIDLRGNALNGSISDVLFDEVKWKDTTLVSVDLSSNLLVGNLPTALTRDEAFDGQTVVKFDISNNPTLNGSIPSGFLSSIYADERLGGTVPLTITLIMDETALIGNLTIPNLDSRLSGRMFALNIYASNSNFTLLNLSGAHHVSYLDISHNTNMNGTLPASLFSSKLTGLVATNTSLTGSFPDLGAMDLSNLERLDLSHTSLDFCATPRTAWNSTDAATCSFEGTNAHECPDLYPSSCSLASNAPPVSSPQTPSFSNCSEATRPSLEFVCIGSTWTYQGNYEGPILTIPGRASTVAIQGNLSASQIIFGGLGSDVLVTVGCASELRTVRISLTTGDLDRIGSGRLTQLLVNLNSTSGCLGDLSSVSIQPNVQGKSCKKVKTEKLGSNGQLSAIFSVDSSGCRTWWIILICVLIPLVVIGVIVFVLLVLFCRPVRECVRPYTKRQRRRQMHSI